MSVRQSRRILWWCFWLACMVFGASAEHIFGFNLWSLALTVSILMLIGLGMLLLATDR